jgi:hypothetical protein
MQRLAPFVVRTHLLAGGSMVGGALTVLALLALWAWRIEGIWVALFLGPVLIVATAPTLVRQADREHSRRLMWLLLAALVVKLLGSLVRYYVSFEVYGGAVDAVAYHEAGSRLAEQFRAGEFDTGLDSLTSTNFVSFFTGLVYTVIGPSIYAGFLLYSWLAFWGLFFLYRAFTIAVPAGNHLTYARLLFFLPSIIYWPSGIGKEALMLFALGLAAFGVARTLTGRTVRGLTIAGLGLWLAALVRPHVAGMAALALAIAYTVGRTQRKRPPAGLLMKIVVTVSLIGLAVLLLSQTASFLEDQGLDPEEGVAAVLDQTTERTTRGGSSFEVPSAGFSPARLPWATLTILFRPFLFEAHNGQALVTALESTILLMLVLTRARPILQAVRSFRRLPYVTFVLVYTGLFVLAFSSIANFGILARERTQLLPFFLVLLAVPGVGRSRPTADPASTSSEPSVPRADGSELVRS